MMIFWWILILAIIIALVKWGAPYLGSDTGNAHNHPRRAQSALDILDERYARGEIDKEEYESRKKDLLR